MLLASLHVFPAGNGNRMYVRLVVLIRQTVDHFVAASRNQTLQASHTTMTVGAKEKSGNEAERIYPTILETTDCANTPTILANKKKVKRIDYQRDSSRAYNANVNEGPELTKPKTY